MLDTYEETLGNVRVEIQSKFKIHTLQALVLFCMTLEASNHWIMFV